MEGELNFFAVLSYMRRWRQKVQSGIPNICALYETVQEHASDAYAFERIKGSVRKILKSTKRHLRADDHTRNLYATAVAENNLDF